MFRPGGKKPQEEKTHPVTFFSQFLIYPQNLGVGGILATKTTLRRNIIAALQRGIELNQAGIRAVSYTHLDVYKRQG